MDLSKMTPEELKLFAEEAINNLKAINKQLNNLWLPTVEIPNKPEIEIITLNGWVV